MKLGRITCMLLLALPTLALNLPSAARAAAPTHVNFSGTEPGVDLCGITATVTYSGVDNFWPIYDASGNLIAFKDTHQELDVFTAANGTSVENHFANQQTAVVTPNPDGSSTAIETYKGLPEQISTPNGPVLSRDVGLITFLDTLDSSGNLIAQTITVDKGPHPDAESGGTLFCQTVIAALS